MKILLILSSILFGSLADEGWVAVERPEAIEEILDEIDPSIWAVFSKKEFDEEFFVRFPVDPVYSHEGSQARFLAESEGKKFLLTIEPRDHFSGYESSWGQEKLIYTPKNVYVLQSNGTPAEHQCFVNSLVIV